MRPASRRHWRTLRRERVTISAMTITASYQSPRLLQLHLQRRHGCSSIQSGLSGYLQDWRCNSQGSIYKRRQDVHEASSKRAYWILTDRKEQFERFETTDPCDLRLLASGELLCRISCLSPEPWVNRRSIHIYDNVFYEMALFMCRFFECPVRDWNDYAKLSTMHIQGFGECPITRRSWIFIILK